MRAVASLTGLSYLDAGQAIRTGTVPSAGFISSVLSIQDVTFHQVFQVWPAVTTFQPLAEALWALCRRVGPATSYSMRSKLVWWPRLR